MPRKKYYKSQKVIETYDHLPPPQSGKFNSKIIRECMAIVESKRYFMRRFECGAAELVCYDYTANKWVVLCFGEAEAKIA